MSQPKLLSEEILKELECPVCMEVIKTRPIFQCENGHLICRNCHPNLHHCPQCRVALRGVRNLMVEKIVADLTVTCPFEGCTQSFIQRVDKRHEAKCKFRPVNCIYKACEETHSWIDYIQHTEDHLIANYTFEVKDKIVFWILPGLRIFFPGFLDSEIFYRDNLTHYRTMFRIRFRKNQWIIFYITFIGLRFEVKKLWVWNYNCVDKCYMDVRKNDQTSTLLLAEKSPKEYLNNIGSMEEMENFFRLDYYEHENLRFELYLKQNKN